MIDYIKVPEGWTSEPYQRGCTVISKPGCGGVNDRLGASRLSQWLVGHWTTGQRNRVHRTWLEGALDRRRDRTASESVRQVIAIVVDNCVGCPFCRGESLPWQCVAAIWHDGVERELPIDVTLPPPDWCPLRSEDRLVTLRRKT